jgi:hypothetical protein
MYVGISMCTNTQMFTFCTYAVDFNSFKLLMNDLLAFEYQPIKIKHKRNSAVLRTLIKIGRAVGKNTSVHFMSYDVTM